MQPEVARVLVSHEGAAALTAAAAYADPASLAAATALRKDFAPELAAAALAQVALRRRAAAKFGTAADELFFTPAGLEQATRPEVARWRAQALAAAGVRRVADLGCGLGTDALAFAAAGLEVRAVELDETTAVLAGANLGHPVGVGRAEDVDLAADEAAYCDPARRGDRGRLWRAEDFTPGWDFVMGLLGRPAGACVKLGPALPHRMVPEGVGARWVSHRGDVVEVSLWTLAYAGFGAVLLPGGHELAAGSGSAPAGDLGAYLFEPDGAVIRAGALGALAERHGLRRIAPDIAYLTGDEPIDSPFLTAFAVREVLPYKEKVLRQWVAAQEVGTLEIKKRGIDIDPATLRKRLRPRGPNAATVVLTPGPAGAYALVVDRVG